MKRNQETVFSRDEKLAIYKYNFDVLQASFKTLDVLLFRARTEGITLDEISWILQIKIVDSHNLLQVFYKFKDSLSDEVYWPALRKFYTSCYNPRLYREALRECFSSNRSKRHLLMEDKAAEVLSKKPSTVTIYRAMSLLEAADGNYGFGWTLKKQVAMFYAKTYFEGDISESNKTVVSLRVPKEKVILLDIADNFEVIYLG